MTSANKTGPDWRDRSSVVVTVTAKLPDSETSTTGHVFVAQTPEAFGHDADGNLTQDGRWVYTWDGENRLVSMETRSCLLYPEGSGIPGKKLEFVYDHMGRRVSKVVSNWTGSAWSFGTATKFVYDGWNLVCELSAVSNQLSATRSYVWGLDLSGSEQGAGGVGGLLFSASSAPLAVNFFAFDGNGNVTSLVDMNDGTLAAAYEYGPFGELIRSTGAMSESNPFRFSTKYQDDETGLLYYGYRYYQPVTGRWINRDPIGEKGFYASCGSWLKDELPSSIGHVNCTGMNDGKCGCKSTMADQPTRALEARSIEEWKAQRTLETLLHNPAIRPLYLFVRNNPASRIDYLGLDSPGCDSVPGRVETPCVLECCAEHDKCYKDHGCTSKSWCVGMAGPIGRFSPCVRCNDRVVACIVRCGTSKKDDPNKPNYYCAKCGVYFDDPKSPHMGHSTD